MISGKRHLGRRYCVPVGASRQGFHQRASGPGIGKQLVTLGMQRMIVRQGAVIQSLEAPFSWLQHPDNEETASGRKADDEPDQSGRRFQT